MGAFKVNLMVGLGASIAVSTAALAASHSGRYLQ
jgi:hypothetical protein